MRYYLIFALLWLSSCQTEAPPTAEVLTDLPMDAERAREVEVLYSDSARLMVRIRGPVMINYTDRSDERQEFPEGVKVDFYDGLGNIKSVLTAKMGTRYNRRGVVVLEDSVVWKSTDNQMLETSELIWNENEGKVYNNKFLVATTPRDTIFGKGFTANQDFTDISIIGTDGKLKVKSLE